MNSIGSLGCPIERIPPELLSEVFLILAGCYGPPDERKREWIVQVSHVCRRWRETALRLSELWAGIICAFPSRVATHTILSRARNCPLVFEETPWPMPSNQESMTSEFRCKLARIHIERIRVLVLTGECDWSEVFNKRTLPILETLELMAHSGDNLPHEGYTDKLSISAPSLRKLTLHGMLFPINAPALLRLELWLRHDFVPSARLLSFLGCTPLLEELFLEDIAPDDAAHDYTGPDVKLLHLRAVTLSGYKDSFLFWKFIQTPLELDMRFNLCERGLIWGEDFSVVLQCMKRYVDSPTLRFLSVNLWDETFDLRRERTDECSQDEKTVGFSFSTIDAGDRLILDEVLDLLGTTLMTWNNIHELELSLFSGDDYDQELSVRPYHTLKPFVKVHTLSIKSSFLHYFLESDGENANDIVLPALHHLIIYLPDSDNHGRKNTWATLVNVLERRSRLGVPISILTVCTHRHHMPPPWKCEWEMLEEIDEEGFQKVNGLVDVVEDKRLPGMYCDLEAKRSSK